MAIALLFFCPYRAFSDSYEAKLRQLHHALSIAPTSERPRLMNQVAKMHLHDSPDSLLYWAKECLRIAVPNGEDWLLAKSFEANAYLVTADYLQALSVASAALDGFPEVSRPLFDAYTRLVFVMVDVYERQGQAAQAEAQLRRVEPYLHLSSDYINSEYYHMKGKICMVLGKTGDARKLFDLSLKSRLLFSEGNPSGLYCSLGNLFYWQGAYHIALSYYQQGLQSSIKHNDLHGIGFHTSNIALCYADMGLPVLALQRYEEALGYFRRGQHRRDIANTLSNMSDVYLALGQPDQALEYALMGLNANILIQEAHQEANSHRDLVNIYTIKGQYAEAKASFQKAQTAYDTLRLGTKMAHLYANAAVLYAQEGKPDSAAYCWQQACTLADSLHLIPTQAQARLGLARFSAHAQALSHYQQAVALALESHNFWLQATVLQVAVSGLHQLGQAKDATQYVQMAVAVADSLERWKSQILLDDFTQRQAAQQHASPPAADRPPYLWMATAAAATFTAILLLYRDRNRRRQYRQVRDTQTRLALQEQSLLERQQRLSLDLQRKEADAQLIAQAKIRAFLQDIQQQLQAEGPARKLIANLQMLVGQYLNDSEGVAPRLEEQSSEASTRLLARLQQVSPLLNPRDLLICSYIHAGVVSREIAALLHIDTASVEKARSRIRKKLPIPEAQSLNEYFLELLEK